ncbi:MAG TPA: YfhO family protein [Actinomycetota bacterium]|nr:YfhO family protein [Actinomycetota bacterium]
MDTATRARRDPMRADAPPPSTARRVLRSAAGPALIVGSVLIALRGIAFLPHLSDQHPDILSFWLPRSCMLGRAIAEGRVPLWNPFEMSGSWFAADPQSGWLSLPAMTTSWLFGCGGGLRALIVLNPILAGLGLFWFLRKERLGRIAATAGGLSLAMAVSASVLAISLPFAGTLAWTPFVLVGASGTFGATGWRRFAWLALAALAWGQVATAHLSHGLVMATGLVVAYVIARAVREVRRGAFRPAAAVGWSVAFLAFLPLANLAILVPHFAVLARSSLSDGYGAIEGTVARVSATEEGVPIPATGIWGAWPLALASTPGGYVGAVVLLLVPFALRDAARRYLVVGLGAVAVVAYLLTNTVLVGAGWFRSFVLALPFGDVYLHNPSRLRYLAFLIVPALGAIGLQWVLDHRPAFGEAMRWIGAGLAVLLILPLLMGARPGRLTIFALASLALVGAVWALARGRRWAPLALCAILAGELLAGAIWSSVYQGGTVYLGLETGSHAALVAAPLRWPDVDVHEYLAPGPIARALRDAGPSDGRYLAWIRPDAYFNKGYLFTRRDSDWPALLIGRSVLFEVPDTLGYSPVQLPGYWAYVHATNRLPVFYNAAVLQVPTLTDLRLLGARYLIVPQGISAPLPPGVSGRTVETEGAYRLVEIDGAQPRASVVPAWTVVEGQRAALEEVLEPGFDPAALAVLETDPGSTPSTSGAPGSAAYREEGPEDVRIEAVASAPSILVVRNAWDEGWSATLDGRPVPVLRADGFLQAVAVPAGRHDVRLTYREPAIGTGLALSGLVWLAFAVAVLVVVLRTRRSAAQEPEGSPVSDEGSAGAPTGSTGA